MKVVIMAGGKGTRIAEVNSQVPKPMIPIDGKPILEYQIETLRRQGYTDIILIVGHLGHVIQDYFGNGSDKGVNIQYIVEEQPLGTAGALYFLKDRITDDFLLLNGDIIFDVDIARFLAHHHSKGTLATILTHPNSHPYDSGIIVADEQGMVTNWMHKEDERLWYQNRRYYSVIKDRQEGKVEAKNLANKQKAIFLDRDGTINKYVGFLRQIDEFELIDGVAEAVKMINESGYLAIVVTNQPVIARGEVSLDELQTIHNKMETLLGQQGAYVDDIFYCPHHPHKGYEGERPEYKIDCKCRKPKPGMLLQAAEKYNINLADSWMIGDGDSDVEAGMNAGCHVVKLGNHVTMRENGICDKVPCFDNLKDAVTSILKDNR